MRLHVLKHGLRQIVREYVPLEDQSKKDRMDTTRLASLMFSVLEFLLLPSLKKSGGETKNAIKNSRRIQRERERERESSDSRSNNKTKCFRCSTL